MEYRIKDWFAGKMTKVYEIGGPLQEVSYTGRTEWSRTYTYTLNKQEFSTIEKESEKAYLINCEFVNSQGTKTKMIKAWVPKSAVETVDEYMAREGARDQRIAEIGMQAYMEERKSAGLARHEALVAWAKDNGVKGVRVKMKRTTLIEKITEAGLKVPTDADLKVTA